MRQVDSQHRLAAMQALIVIDDLATSSLLKKQLVAAGYVVYIARSGREGLERALQLRPQLVIADWALPDLDGAAFCRTLRETRSGRDVYLLLLASLADEEKLYRAFDAGADDCLAKPVNPDALSARLRAGQWRTQLQRESEKDAEEMRRFAAELAVTNQRLRETALTDLATGLPNRRHALRLLAREWSASLRRERPLSCMVIEIDGLKQLADLDGRAPGEALLKGLCRVLRSLSRTRDELCRLGGSVFLVICPEADLAAAYRAAERLRTEIGRLPIKLSGRILKVSLSAGVACREPAMAGPEALIKAAQQALRLAKQTGRSRTCTSPGPLPPGVSGG